MACIALHGYHGIAKYSWSFNSKPIIGEESPILYTKSQGIYEVLVTIPTGKVLMQGFETTGTGIQSLYIDIFIASPPT